VNATRGVLGWRADVYYDAFADLHTATIPHLPQVQATARTRHQALAELQVRVAEEIGPTAGRLRGWATTPLLSLLLVGLTLRLVDNAVADQRRGQLELAWAFRRFLEAASAIGGSRRATTLLQGRGRFEALLQEEAQAAVTQLRDDHFWQDLEGGEELLTKAMGGVEDITRKVFAHFEESLAATIDSSSLVFMHAALDDTLLQCVAAIAHAAPRHLEDRVERRKIELREVRDSEYDRLLDQKLDQFLLQLERESLLVKTDLLLGVLRPTARELRGVHQFDRDRLSELDRQRHDVVHGSGLRQLPNIEDDLAFIQFVGFLFWGLVGTRIPETADPALWTGPIPKVGTERA